MLVYLFEPFWVCFSVVLFLGGRPHLVIVTGGTVRWARGIEGPPPNQKYQMGSPPDTKKIKPGIPRDAPGDESVHEGSGPGGATPSGEAS